ncbi:MAG: MEDS domain-containing protein [Acidobacteria bacterium]|nr:MEDS domain-containing protein [Acidobacteriota bacterium]
MLGSQKTSDAIELGIRGQYAHPGDHIAYFWMDESEFREGVKFIEVGLEQGDYCVVFGYEEANLRVLEVLRPKFDSQELQNESRLSVIHGVSSADAMLGQIGADFEAALGRGAKRLRLLGNIGWGRPDWPDENQILAFEARVTAAAKPLPAVIVCMYDVRAVTGRIIYQGAFETHPLTICRNVLRENPAYVPLEQYLASVGQ